MVVRMKPADNTLETNSFTSRNDYYVSVNLSCHWKKQQHNNNDNNNRNNNKKEARKVLPSDRSTLDWLAAATMPPPLVGLDTIQLILILCRQIQKSKNTNTGENTKTGENINTNTNAEMVGLDTIQLILILNHSVTFSHGFFAISC